MVTERRSRGYVAVTYVPVGNWATGELADLVVRDPKTPLAKRCPSALRAVGALGSLRAPLRRGASAVRVTRRRGWGMG